MPDGTVIYVEEVRTGRNKLAFKTIYKKKGNHLDSLIDSNENPSTFTPETLSNPLPSENKGTEISESPKSEEKAPNTVGVSHENLKNLATDIGLPEIKRGQVLTPEEYANRGRKLIAGGADPNEFVNSDAPLDDKISVARAHLETLVKRVNAIDDKNSKEYQAAYNEMQDYTLNIVKPLGTQWAAAGRALQGFRDIVTDTFESIKANIEKSTGKLLTSKQVDEIKKLSDENKKLIAKLNEAEKKLIEQHDKDHDTEDENNSEANDKKSEDAKKSYKDAAKDLATKIRRAKIHKPGIFSAATPASLAWDSAVELVAKTVELGGSVADALSKGIDHIKNTDWYKSLTEDKKKIAERAFKNWHYGYVDTNPYSRKVNRLEEQLENLKNNIEKKYSSKGFAMTIEQQTKISQLQSEIRAAKRNIELSKKANGNPETREEEIANDQARLAMLQEHFEDKKDDQFTPIEAKNIWSYIKKAYISQGVGYNEAISLAAQNLGLNNNQIRSAIITPKSKPLTDAVWKYQTELTKNGNAIKRYVDWTKESTFGKVTNTIVNSFRTAATFGHGGVFVGTHAGMSMYSNPVLTFKAFMDANKMAYGNREAYSEMISELKNRDNYIVAQRAGLKNNPDRFDNDEELLAEHSKLGWFNKSGERGFNAIKILRQNLFDHYYDRLSPAEKLDMNVLKEISSLVNNATGATNIHIPDLINHATFAGGMEIARFEKLIKNPAKASYFAAKWLAGKATPAERVFAKIWAQRAGTQLGVMVSLLGINKAINAYFFPNDKKKEVNLTDVLEYGWGMYNIGGFHFDNSSGMISATQFLMKVGDALHADRKELQKRYHTNSNWGAAGALALRRARGKLSPFWGHLADAVDGRTFMGNSLPWSDTKPFKTGHKMTWGEYIGYYLPIPIAEGVQEYYNSAHKEGMSQQQFTNFFKGALSAAVSGSTGFRLSEVDDENGNDDNVSLNNSDVQNESFRDPNSADYRSE